MISFQIPPESSSIQRVTINNIIFYIQLDFSTREQSWYFTLLDVSRNTLLSGRKIQYGVSVTAHAEISSLAGNIYIYRTKDTSEDLGRNNFGQDLDYEMIWLSTSEEQALLS